ncbi:MAG: hypothetical protein GX607_00770 [Myxococcales bacterium]|mgnify:CR=1 FL=1|jgi:hypothetical protein|nr:hypothetical protein [Myxococcales bacterium]
MGRRMRLVAASSLGLGFGFGVALVPAVAQQEKAPQGEMEVTGPVTNLSGTCPSLQFTIATQQVTTDANTEFDDGTCDAIVNGLAVEVEGMVGSDGVLAAEEVDLKVD